MITHLSPEASYVADAKAILLERILISAFL